MSSLPALRENDSKASCGQVLALFEWRILPGIHRFLLFLLFLQEIISDERF
jgi:hypothetical protein